MGKESTNSADAEAILRARAQALSIASVIHGQLAVLEVIEFGLGSERYAFEMDYVGSVHLLDDLTPLPGTPPFVAGIVNVRGRILPVINIKEFFELTEMGIVDGHKVLLIRTEELELGILADTVAGVLSVPLESIQPSLPTLAGVRADYMKGVTAERLVILDASRILTDSQIIVHEDVEPRQIATA